jgi:hypothetical protein
MIETSSKAAFVSTDFIQIGARVDALVAVLITFSDCFFEQAEQAHAAALSIVTNGNSPSVILLEASCFQRNLGNTDCVIDFATSSGSNLTMGEGNCMFNESDVAILVSGNGQVTNQDRVDFECVTCQRVPFVTMTEQFSNSGLWNSTDVFGVPEPDDDKLSDWAIGGIVFASEVLAVLVCLVILCVVRNKAKENWEDEPRIDEQVTKETELVENLDDDMNNFNASSALPPWMMTDKVSQHGVDTDGPSRSRSEGGSGVATGDNSEDVGFVC